MSYTTLNLTYKNTVTKNVNVQFYHGFLTDCPDTCFNQICDKSSGQCIFGCMPGYWDFNCSSSCSENCLNRNCSITNGTCDTCIRERYGDTCDKMCSPGCVSQSCDRQSGACSDGCRPYWAGEYCDSMYLTMKFTQRKK